MAVVKIALDWDGTLVNEHQTWLPGARDALQVMLRRDHKVTIHSARANWDGGQEQSRDRLANLADRVSIIGKPMCDLYVGDNYISYDGDWPATLNQILNGRNTR